MTTFGSSPVPVRLTRVAIAIGFAGLVGWLLVLNTTQEGPGSLPYRPLTPQAAAQKCSAEAGITRNEPGTRLSIVQMERLTACMDREISANGFAD